MSRHSNISIFIPHIGCPHKCSFCDQRIISGSKNIPHGDDVRRICEQAMQEIADKSSTQIAFFGGSFTAVPRDYMIELLTAARDYVGEGKFSGIRISTRPDFIDGEILSILKSYGVTSIELGAQSLSDNVLTANERGHSAEDIYSASQLIRDGGFELGLQIIPGLYKSTMEDEQQTIEGVLKIKPDTIRIYPIVVIEGTKLADYYKKGEYELMPFEDMVSLCADMMMQFEQSDIRVIKCGLHASDGVEGERVAGFYHPAFRELCQGEIYKKEILRLTGGKAGRYEVLVGKSHISKAVGHKRQNIDFFKNMGIEVSIKGNDDIPLYSVKENNVCI